MYKKYKMQVNDSHPNFEIVSVVSINYTTESKTSYFYNKLKAPFGETLWLTGCHAMPLVI